MTTSHKTNWREARLAIQADQEKMKLPEGKTCNHCAHIEHCKWMFGISGTETECNIFPSRFYDDVMTIYHRDGTKTEVTHPFDAMKTSEEHKIWKDHRVRIAIEVSRVRLFDADDNQLPEIQDPDWAVKAARAVIIDLCDRRNIKHGFENIDTDIRLDIVDTMASIIRAVYEEEPCEYIESLKIRASEIESHGHKLAGELRHILILNLLHGTKRIRDKILALLDEWEDMTSPL